MKKAIINGQVFIEGTFKRGLALVFDETISQILPQDHVSLNIECIDVKGAFVVPGFIDIHVHGMGGYDTMDATYDALSTLSNQMVKHGVTSFLATTVTHEVDVIKRAIDNVRQHAKNLPGAKCVGVHLEGPFINPAKKGAHEQALILPPDDQVFSDDADMIKLVTYAPECDDQDKMLKWSKETGIRLSLGHSDATYAQAMSAFNKGVNSVTHLFNAMRPMSHREPGVVGAALLSDVYTELIADKVHVHPDLFNMVFRQKTNQRLMLVTDCMCAGCMQPGKYNLGQLSVNVDHEKATLADGTLAGSILTMNRALEHFAQHVDVPLEDIMPLMAANQANLLGLDTLGKLAVGCAADMVVLDASLQVLQTYVNGQAKL